MKQPQSILQRYDVKNNKGSMSMGCELHSDEEIYVRTSFDNCLSLYVVFSRFLRY